MIQLECVKVRFLALISKLKLEGHFPLKHKREAAWKMF